MGAPGAGEERWREGGAAAAAPTPPLHLQVSNRAILPGAALLEAGRATATALAPAHGARAALARASLAAPLLLDRLPDAVEVGVDTATGAVSVSSTRQRERTAHLTATVVSAAAASPVRAVAHRRRHALDRRQRDVLLLPVAMASITPPPLDGTGVHPAALDAVMHTAAAARAPDPGATRVPASVELYVAPAAGAVRAGTAFGALDDRARAGAWKASYSLGGAARLVGVALTPVESARVSTGSPMTACAVDWQAAVVARGRERARSLARAPPSPLSACSDGLRRLRAGQSLDAGTEGLSAGPAPAARDGTAARAALRALAKAALVEGVATNSTGLDALAVAGVELAPRVGAAALSCTCPSLATSSRATLLIPGGSGAVGGLVAAWGAASGAASQVVVVGRGVLAAPCSAALAVAARCDASCAADAAEARMLVVNPIITNFLASGALADGTLARVAPTALRVACAPKAASAARLGRALACHPVASHLFCSSAAALLGSPGQAAYGAANAGLDAAAAVVTAAGLPALSVQWGAWGVVGGMASAAVAARLARGGMAPLWPADGVAAVGKSGDWEKWSETAGFPLPRAPAHTSAYLRIFAPRRGARPPVLFRRRGRRV